jgi:hypothetical protein
MGGTQENQSRDGTTGRIYSTGRQYGDGIILMKEKKIHVADIIIGNDDVMETSPIQPGPVYVGNWTNETYYRSQHPVADTDPSDDNPYWTWGPIYNAVQDLWNWGHKEIASGSFGSVTYAPTIGRSGVYEVYEWHGWEGKTAIANTEEETVPWTLWVNNPGWGAHGSRGTGTFDQSTNAGQWNLLTRTFLARGDSVRLVITNSGADDTVLADAVMFRYTGTPVSSLAAAGGSVSSPKIRVLTGDPFVDGDDDSAWVTDDETAHLELTKGGNVMILLSDVSDTSEMTITYSVDGGEEIIGLRTYKLLDYDDYPDVDPAENAKIDAYYHEGWFADTTVLHYIHKVAAGGDYWDGNTPWEELFVFLDEPRWGVWTAFYDLYAVCLPSEGVGGDGSSDATNCDAGTACTKWWTNTKGEACVPIVLWADSTSTWIDPNGDAADQPTAYEITFKVYDGALTGESNNLHLVR